MIKSIFKSIELVHTKQCIINSTRSYKFLPKSDYIIAANKKVTTKIDEATAEHLERLSLVGIESEKGVKILEEAIAFADYINEVDTTNVRPLITVLENESLYLREDDPKTDVTRSELLSYSKSTKENYYYTPPGNVTYIPEKKSFELPKSKAASEN